MSITTFTSQIVFYNLTKQECKDLLLKLLKQPYLTSFNWRNLPCAELSVMTVLKKNIFVPGLTTRWTSILMYPAPSSTVYDDAVNDRSSGGGHKEKRI